MSQTGAQLGQPHNCKDHDRCVKIMDKHGHIDTDPITVKWKEGEQVVWMTSLQEEFTVVFENGSPFPTGTFRVPAGGSVHSGPATKGGQYKYTVYGPDGVHDPTVDLQPPG